MGHESDYYRARARAECEAAFNATSATARGAHARLARAYQLRAEVQELERLGSLATGKVTSIAKALHDREPSD
jgi:hypothetical protein